MVSKKAKEDKEKVEFEKEIQREYKTLENEFNYVFTYQYIEKLKRIVSDEDLNELREKYIQLSGYMKDEGFTNDEVSFCCGLVLSSLNITQKEKMKNGEVDGIQQEERKKRND